MTTTTTTQPAPQEGQTNTPPPWALRHGHPSQIIDADFKTVAECMTNFRQRREERANAAHIVRCVNERAALVEALKQAQRNEAICHCGDAVSAHHMGSGHSPVELLERCPNEEVATTLRKKNAAFIDVLERIAGLTGETSAVTLFEAQNLAVAALAKREDSK